MFQAKTWSWKRVAANLLLVPILGGGAAAVVNGQLGKTGGPAAPVMPAVGPAKADRAAAPSSGDPKQLLKDGRKALAEGRFDAAQDLAMAAEANNPGGKWGLFDDTPAALRKDIAEASAKANKGQSEQLVKQAKALAAKGGSEAERAYNLDAALQLARKADQLHGPYSMWDTGERADKLVKELEASRAKIKVAATKPTTAPTAPANTAVTTAKPAPVTPASGSKAVGGDNKRTIALKLMGEGRALADQGNYVAAKAKFAEADAVGATFGPGEFTPGFALQDLNARGAAAMDKLVREAQTLTTQKEYAKADAALTQAAQIAATLGLFPKPVAEAKAALAAASNSKFGTPAAPGVASVGPSPSGLAPAGGPEFLVPAGTNTAVAPAAPAGTQTVYNGTKPNTPAGTATGRQLLDQAAYEFKKGEFETAQRLAIQAHNLGAQQEAAALLNSIDAEKLEQKKRVAATSVANAKAAFEQKDYQRAMGVLVLVDGNLLAADLKAKRDEMLAACKAELDKAGTANSGVVTAAAKQPEPLAPTAEPKSPTPTVDPPGTARVGPDAKTDNPAAAADAMRRVQVQKVRAESLKVQDEAQKAFGRGETDLAMQMLLNNANQIRSSGLDSGSVAQLLRPVEARLDTFRLMKGQADAVARQNKERNEAKDIIKSRGAAEEERKREVAGLMRRYQDLMKKNDYAAAERVALQAKQLDPDDPAVGAMAELAKMTARVRRAEQDKLEKEQFVLGSLNDADRTGPLVTADNPVAVKLDALRRAGSRGSLDNAYLKTKSPAEFEIDQKLEKPISVDFNQTPLDQAIENLKTLTKLPIIIDARGLADEKISEVQLVTYNPGIAVATKNVLATVLDGAGLSYVVEHDVVKVTTLKKSKGRLLTKVFSVADLVTPVPNFALPDYANFDKMLTQSPLKSGALAMQGVNLGSSATPFVPSGGLGGGTAASTPLPGTQATTPGIQSPAGFSGGTLQTQQSPLAGSANVTNANNSKHEQLIKLITSMVRPYSWDGSGANGGGKIEYFDIGSALVVNQTADVIQEIQDLLEALRRLQDLAVAVEIRIVSLAEEFFERMGLDFSVNIKTHTASFEPALTSNSFRPQPFINDINNKGVTLGLTPAGSFTPDLDVPIRATSFQRAIPGFGGYPNQPGNNGGISLGLAFLNDIQVFTFMEMAQGDRRTNIMQAPKLTLFNGQTATLAVNNLEFFVTQVQVLAVNGQIVFVPQNTPLPGPGDFNQGGALNVTVQAVVSADRRFVRLNLPVILSAQSGASVPLFPITTFVTPVFEGGSQGQPIPFTQFLQQPAFTTLNISTTVVCPDGGTVLLGGLKTLAENRNEFGPPFLSKIPYLNRLFKNVGVGRDTRHIMIMVTPRIIINSEEEIFQTEGRPPTQ